MPDLQDLKQSLRKTKRLERCAVAKQLRQIWTPQLNQAVLGSPAVQGASCIGAFLAFDGEPDLRFSLTQLHRRGHQVAVPVLPEDKESDLQFRDWSPATPLNANQYGISEPAPATSARGNTVMLSQIDVLLIPLVAYDLQGGRLGMGAGWYDRTLGNADHKPLCVGIAWGLQEVPAVPLEPWDIPLDAVVNEQGWFTFR